jgi:hypothetical protein
MGCLPLLDKPQLPLGIAACPDLVFAEISIFLKRFSHLAKEQKCIGHIGSVAVSSFGTYTCFMLS